MHYRHRAIKAERETEYVFQYIVLKSLTFFHSDTVIIISSDEAEQTQRGFKQMGRLSSKYVFFFHHNSDRFISEIYLHISKKEELNDRTIRTRSSSGMYVLQLLLSCYMS